AAGMRRVVHRERSGGVDRQRAEGRRVAMRRTSMSVLKTSAVLAFACLSIAAQDPNRVVTEADCTAAPLVATIAPKEIGEPVRSVSLQAAWVPGTETVPAHCRIDGVFAPVDTAATARVINFRVILPASWNHKGAQMGGGGING